jgi:dihydroflavonol-4-reductase
MKVLVTGATGFVGCHAVVELLKAGHSVRLLVRRPEQVPRTFGPLGIEPPEEVVQGDVTDPGSVARAVEGCDAVVHAASVYSLDPRQADAIRQTNVTGTRHVIEAAIANALDPIVHISSYAALLPAAGETLHPDAPPGVGVGVYSVSKAESERLARNYQETGAPVVTVMPGGVWGPHDPYFGESNQIVTEYLKGNMRLVNASGRFSIVDVRDLAFGIASTVQPGLGPRRYMMAGTLVSSADAADLLAEVTGTRRRYLTVPTGFVGTTAALLTPVERIAPFRLPLTSEQARLGTQDIRAVDDSRAVRELGFKPRPVDETVADTVRSLVASGRLGKEAGRLAQAKATE